MRTGTGHEIPALHSILSGFWETDLPSKFAVVLGQLIPTHKVRQSFKKVQKDYMEAHTGLLSMQYSDCVLQNMCSFQH